MKRRKFLHAGLAALSLAALVPSSPLAAADLPPLSHSLTRRTPAPAPALELADLDGRSHDLAALRGNMVLINFWATWCPPCRREMPSLERLSQALADEPFRVLAVDVGEDAETVEAFFGQLDTAPSFPVLLDARGDAMQAWKVGGLPTTVLVDGQGRVVAQAIGGREFDHPALVQAIRALLRK